jgi:hypothetical protein
MRHPLAIRLAFAIAVGILATAANAQSASEQFGPWKVGASPSSAAGTRVFTYSMVQSSQIYPTASGCQRITSPAALLERSRISLAVWRREIAAAFAMWEAVSNLRFLEVDNVSADILIGAQANPQGAEILSADYDVRVPANVKPRARALICLDPDATWKVGPSASLAPSNLRYAIAYEIGTAIGLDYPADGRNIEQQKGGGTGRGSNEEHTSALIALEPPLRTM